MDSFNHLNSNLNSHLCSKGCWFLYLIQAENGKIYTGITTNLIRRAREHLIYPGIKGAKFFMQSPPVFLSYWEPHLNRSEATIREREIKKFSREKKLKMIQSFPLKPLLIKELSEK